MPKAYPACRRQRPDEPAVYQQVPRLLGHECEDMTRIYPASLREGGERHG